LLIIFFHCEKTQGYIKKTTLLINRALNAVSSSNIVELKQTEKELMDLLDEINPERNKNP
jgi:hypothetical protein